MPPSDCRVPADAESLAGFVTSILCLYDRDGDRAAPAGRLPAHKERVEARGVSGSVAAAAAHQDAVDRLRELAERLGEEHGAVTDDEQQAALDRIAAIDRGHDEQRSRPDEAA